MTPGVVSEDLFRQQLQVTGQLAGAVAESGRTLGQVVAIQQVQHDQLKTLSEMLIRQDAARGEAVADMKDSMADMATGLRVHVSEQVTHAVNRMEVTVSREVDRLEFWRKPAVVLTGLVALATLIVDTVLRIVMAVKG